MKKDWTYKKLIDVCGIQYGYPFDSKCFTEDNTYPALIRIRDVVRGYTETFYKGDVPEEYYVQKGEYLIGMDGEFNIAPWRSEKALLNQRVCKIFSITSNVDIQFVYYSLQRQLKQIEDETPFVTVKHLSAKKLNQIELPIPPLSIQRSIVAELDLLHSVISKKKEQRRELDNLAQSLFYQMFGDPITNPMGWEVKKLGEVAPVKSYQGEILSEKGLYWLLNLDMVEAQTGKILEKNMVDKDEIGNSTTSFSPDNVLYSKLRPYLNKVVLPDTCGYCTTELLPLLPQRDILNREYLCYLLRSKSFVDYINIKVAGAKMPRVTMDDLRNFSIPLPPLSLQQSFAAKVSAIEVQKQAITQSIKETEALLAQRMDTYFS